MQATCIGDRAEKSQMQATLATEVEGIVKVEMEIEMHGLELKKNKWTREKWNSNCRRRR